VGGGLAGSEAAWALAARGVTVTLCEMRPVRMTAAHQTDRLAELVCSNSFKSVELGNAHGLLKAELRRLGSVVLEAADAARVPGGAALAVDRTAFAQGVHDRVTRHPKITVVRQAARRGVARLLRRDRADRRRRLARSRAAVSRLALRQGRRRRLPERALHRSAIRRVRHGAPHRGAVSAAS